MKYIIIGAGGTGGILGFYMTKAGKDVTLIARNAHLEAMKKQGLSVQKNVDKRNGNHTCRCRKYGIL